MSKYPTLDRISETADGREAIENFVEWLESKGYILGETIGENPWDRFVPCIKPWRELIVEHFEIDEAQTDRERKALLDEFFLPQT